MKLILVRKLILLGLIAGLLTAISVPKAEAFLDPVTLAILTPIALKVAEKAAPYIKNGLVSGGKQLLKMGTSAFEILKLPWGFLQATLGAPFGGFTGGLVNILEGCIAPVKLVGHTLLFPIALFGVDFN